MNKITIRDRRQPGWFWVDARLVKRDGGDLGAYAIAAYCVLAAHADNETQTCFPSIATIADMIGTSAPTARKAVRLLEEWGWIAIVTARKNPDGSPAPNEYILLPTPEKTTVSTKSDLVLKEVSRGTKPRLDELDSINKTQSNGRKKDELFEAVLSGSFGVTYQSGMSLPKQTSGHINAICRELRQLDPPPTGQEMTDYYTWWRGQNPDLSPIRSASTLPLSVMEYRQARGNHQEPERKYKKVVEL